MHQRTWPAPRRGVPPGRQCRRASPETRPPAARGAAAAPAPARTTPSLRPPINQRVSGDSCVRSDTARDCVSAPTHIPQRTPPRPRSSAARTAPRSRSRPPAARVPARQTTSEISNFTRATRESGTAPQRTFSPSRCRRARHGRRTASRCAAAPHCARVIDAQTTSTTSGPNQLTWMQRRPCTQTARGRRG